MPKNKEKEKPSEPDTYSRLAQQIKRTDTDEALAATSIQEDFRQKEDEKKQRLENQATAILTQLTNQLDILDAQDLFRSISRVTGYPTFAGIYHKSRIYWFSKGITMYDDDFPLDTLHKKIQANIEDKTKPHQLGIAIGILTDQPNSSPNWNKKMVLLCLVNQSRQVTVQYTELYKHTDSLAYECGFGEKGDTLGTSFRIPNVLVADRNTPLMELRALFGKEKSELLAVTRNRFCYALDTIIQDRLRMQIRRSLNTTTGPV